MLVTKYNDKKEKRKIQTSEFDSSFFSIDAKQNNNKISQTHKTPNFLFSLFHSFFHLFFFFRPTFLFYIFDLPN